jgi:hypothetical protein
MQIVCSNLNRRVSDAKGVGQAGPFPRRLATRRSMRSSRKNKTRTSRAKKATRRCSGVRDAIFPSEAGRSVSVIEEGYKAAVELF